MLLIVALEYREIEWEWMCQGSALFIMNSVVYNMTFEIFAHVKDLFYHVYFT